MLHPHHPALSLAVRVAKLGATLAVATLLVSCDGDLGSQNASGSSASVGNQGAGSASSIQSQPANPGSVPNAGAFPANAGGGPR